MRTMIAFVVGFILGVWFGFIVTAVLIAGRDDRR